MASVEDDLRAEVQRLTEHKVEWRDAAHHNKRQWIAAVERAESAEADLRALREGLEALADEVDRWRPYESRDSGEVFSADAVWDIQRDLRALLALSPGTIRTQIPVSVDGLSQGAGGTCPSECAETNHPRREHGQWIAAPAPAEGTGEACPGCGSKSCKWKRLECESPVTDGSKP